MNSVYTIVLSLLWNIQTIGQEPNWEYINAFMTLGRCFKSMNPAILDNAYSFWDIFQQRVDTCSSNDNLWSILITKTFSDVEL